MYVLFTGEQLDFRPLDAFLQKQKIELWRRELLIQDVWNAFCRYAASPDPDKKETKWLKTRFARVLAATQKLDMELKALNLGGIGYAQFVYLMGQTMPPNIPKELESEPVRALRDLRDNVEKVSRGADAALKGLKKPGPPTKAKTTFVCELARAWKAHTGEEPGKSGEATWDKPTTPFAHFVTKVVICTVSTKGEGFKAEFTDLLLRACDLAQPTQKI